MFNFIKLYEELCALNENTQSIEYREVTDLDLFRNYDKNIFKSDTKMSDEDIKNNIKELYIDNKLVGYIGFSIYNEEDSKCLGIGNFMIIDRGKDYGTAIIKDIIEKYKNDFDLIYCYVNANNEQAIKLYNKLGKVYTEYGTNDDNEYFVTFYDNRKNDN